MVDIGEGEWLSDQGRPVRHLTAADDSAGEQGHARSAVVALLASNQPFDPVSWLRARRWARRAAMMEVRPAS